MTFLLPQFDNKYLRYFYSCARLDNIPTELYKSLGLGEKNEFESTYQTNRGTAFIQIVLELDTDHNSKEYVHFHMNCALESYFGSSGRGEYEDSGLEAVERAFNRISGNALTGANVGTDFRIPLDDLPKSGTIRLLHGAKSRVSGAKLAVTGVQARFLDKDVVWRKMDWEVKKGTECPMIAVRMKASMPDLYVGDDYVTSLYAMSISAFDKYVLEVEESGDDEE
jgi:hypothetical protein